MNCQPCALTRESPRKVKVDNSVCNHHLIAGWKDYGGGGSNGYFKKEYLEKHPTWPKNCADCSKLFHAKVGKVFLCPKGANTKHKCTFGLCQDCAKAKGNFTPPKRNRKAKVIMD